MSEYELPVHFAIWKYELRFMFSTSLRKKPKQKKEKKMDPRKIVNYIQNSHYQTNLIILHNSKTGTDDENTNTRFIFASSFHLLNKNNVKKKLLQMQGCRSTNYRFIFPLEIRTEIHFLIHFMLRFCFRIRTFIWSCLIFNFWIRMIIVLYLFPIRNFILR